ncbi:MAG: tol-pal system YbgF family protein [Bacteroidales bacterium]
MKRYLHYLGIALLFTTFSCNNSSTESKESLTKAIKNLEKELFSSKKEIAKEKAKKIVNLYCEYVDKKPETKEAPEYLLKAADVAMHTNQEVRAMDLLNKIQKDYPSFEEIDIAIFLCGHLYEDYFKNLKQAKIYYNKVINEYPNSQFSDDAKSAIDNLGLTPEQMLKKFMEKNKNKQ